MRCRLKAIAQPLYEVNAKQNQRKKSMKRILSFILVVFFSGHSHAEVQRSVGDVHEVSSNKLIYQEHHTFSYSPADEYMQTEYKALDKSIIAKRRVNFDNGYAKDYVFEQPGLNQKTSVVRGESEIEYIAEKGDEVKSKSFSVDDISTAVVNAGMFNAVERHWSQLIKGEKISIDLVVPERGRTYTMNISQVKLDGSKMSEHMATEGKIVFNLVIASRLLRLLVAPVELGYDLNTKRLVFYQGPSNIKKPSGKKYGDIWIKYDNF